MTTSGHFPLQFSAPIAGNTETDGTLSIGVGAVRKSGLLGRIPNCSAVRQHPPQPCKPRGPPPPLQAPKSFCARLGVNLRIDGPPPMTSRALFPGYTLQPLGEGPMLAFRAGAVSPGLLAALGAFFPVEEAPPRD